MPRLRFGIGDGGAIARSIVLWSVLLASPILATVADAHSLEELKATLYKSEKYFEPLDKPAPEFTLRDADGEIFSYADSRVRSSFCILSTRAAPTSARFTPTASPKSRRWSTGRR